MRPRSAWSKQPVTAALSPPPPDFPNLAGVRPASALKLPFPTRCSAGARIDRIRAPGSRPQPARSDVAGAVERMRPTMVPLSVLPVSKLDAPATSSAIRVSSPV